MTHLPTWPIIRILGLVAYTLLAAGICLGIAYSLPLKMGKRKALLYKMHTFCTISGTALGLLHGAFTVIDTYMPFSWRELLVPFTAEHAPILNGIGTLAGYAMLIVIFTSDIRNKLKKRVWHLIHLLSYPIFVMTSIHGYFLGTDTKELGIRWLYLIAVLAVLAMTAVRMLIQPGPKNPAKAQYSAARK
jgi:methionine sulfoxide reductase heme-binding subunit